MWQKILSTAMACRQRTTFTCIGLIKVCTRRRNKYLEESSVFPSLFLSTPLYTHSYFTIHHSSLTPNVVHCNGTKMYCIIELPFLPFLIRLTDSVTVNRCRYAVSLGSVIKIRSRLTFSTFPLFFVILADISQFSSSCITFKFPTS